MVTKIEIEDALKHLRNCEVEGSEATARSLAGALGATPARAFEVVAALLDAGYVTSVGAGWALSDAGRAIGNDILRAHRLYETYLANKTGSPPAAWHAAAEVKEHQLGAAEVARLERALGRPRFDPHGDPIPSPEGSLPEAKGTPLADCPVGSVGEIDHVEDEPETVFATIVRLGLAPGMRLRVLRQDAREIAIELEGREISIPRALAANVSVALGDAEAEGDWPSTRRLSDLEFGQSARIAGLGRNCRGSGRRRLLDLGIVSGNLIQADRQAPFNGPRAYRVCGSVVALRGEQADQIFIADPEDSK